MAILIRVILGTLIMAAGTAMTIKTEYFLNNFGRIEWFEMKMGMSGGSRFGYKLIGIIIIFLGVLTTFGMIGGFVNWILSPLTKYTAYPEATNTVQEIEF